MQFPLSSLLNRAILVGTVVLTFSQLASAKASFTVKAPPTWVRKVVPSSAISSATQSGKSSTRVLDDQQIKVSGKSVERYYHFYRRVDNTAGLNDLSQLRFYFEPSYQQLAIHFVRIIRGSSVIESLNPAEVKTVQKETELDQQLYNGTLAAVIFVNDIRVGDIVEYAYTITGDNPVMGGRFTETVYLADTEPIEEMILRLVYPSNRQLAIKNDNTQLEPTKTSIGEDTEYLWYSKNVNAVDSEDSTPDWFNPYPRINLSEFQNWSEVVNWALPFYQNSPLNNQALRAKVEEWRKASEAPGVRAIAALRFVQDEIRYLGIELGRYSHQPTVPEKVFARRFGDCKDKSLLLSSILNAMGIEAAPALVNTNERASLDKWQATPFAFDHVIVQTKINGKTYWFDPTISYQRGGLEYYYDPPFERALVLRVDTKDLEKIPVPLSDAGSVDIVEVYSGQDSQSPISLTVTKTYRGTEADDMRYSLSSSSLSDLSKSRLNFYADSTPSIIADGLPQVEDDQQTNVLVIKEKYSIPELWKDDRHSFFAGRIYAELEKPHVSQRSAPLEVNYPLSIRQTILINIGGGYDFPIESDVLSDNALRFEYRYSKNGNQLGMYFSLKTFSDSVSTTELQSHLALLDRAQQLVGFDLSRSGSAVLISRESGNTSGVMVALVWIVILLPVALFVVWLVRGRAKRHRRTQFAKDLQPLPGASPETALRLSSEEQVESMLLDYSCRCGQRPYNSESPAKRERFIYDGQRLLGIRLQCPACRQYSDVYVNPLFEREAEGFAN